MDPNGPTRYEAVFCVHDMKEDAVQKYSYYSMNNNLCIGGLTQHCISRRQEQGISEVFLRSAPPFSLLLLNGWRRDQPFPTMSTRSTLLTFIHLAAGLNRDLMHLLYMCRPCAIKVSDGMIESLHL